MVEIYRTKVAKTNGSDLKEVKKKVTLAYKLIVGRSKRKAHIRSNYFKKDKVFLELFWIHLSEKNFWEQKRRLQFFNCGIDLIKNSQFKPGIKINPNKHSELLYRFTGTTQKNEYFYVQIKEDKKSGKKWLMSIFPA